MTQYLHQSTISKATGCAQALEFYLDRSRPYSTGANRALGTSYHAGIEELYNYLLHHNHDAPHEDLVGMLPFMIIAAAEAMAEEVAKGGDQFNWQYQAPTARKERIVLDEAQANRMVAKLLTSYVEDKRYWPPSRYKVIAVEHTFELPMPGWDDWQRRGTIDLILRDSETWWIHGVDHKTAKTKWQAGKESHGNTPQPAFYTLALQELLGEAEVAFYFDVMSFEGTFQRIEAMAGPQHIEATMLKAHRVVELVEKNGPFLPNTDSFLCSPHYCDYWAECPYGSVLKG